MTIEQKADTLDLHETKSYDPQLGEAMHDFLHAFEDFKEANDERLSEIESKANSDILVTEKVNRINKSLDEQKQNIDRLMLEQRRPARGAARETITQPSEHKKAFESYVRAGDISAFHALEGKSLNASTDSEGGYLAPEETQMLIDSAVRTISPIRQIASVRQIGSNSYRKPISTTGAASGWVSETALRPETAAPSLSAVDFPTMELYAMPATSQALLDDSIVDIEQWIADEVQQEFASQEGAAFVTGDGVNMPRGFLSYPIVEDSAQGWGQIGSISTGVDAGFDDANPADALIDLIYAPKQSFRANGRFVMNRSVVGALRKFKDSEGNYLWQPALNGDSAATLLGYPVTEAEDMPDIAAGSHSIAFGDFERGYLIVDRVGIRILRDPFSAKPYVLFYTTKRVGGGVQNFDAIKVLKFAS